MFDVEVVAQSVIVGFFRGLPFGLALLLGLALPVAILTGGALLRRLPKSSQLALIVGVIAAGVCFSIAFSGRVLYSSSEIQSFGVSPQTVGGAVGVRLSQLFSIIALFVAAAVLLISIVGRAAISGRALVVGLGLSFFFLMTVVVSGVVGNYREPRFNDFYFVFVGWAVIYLADGVNHNFWRWIRITLMFPILGSLVAMLVAPKLVLQPGYATSLIPGFAERLYGLADHANALGPIAVIAMAIELCPKVRPRPSFLFLLPQVLVLLLTQSKTAWLAALLVIPIVRWQWLNDRSSHRDRWTVSVVIIVCGLALAILAALVVLVAVQSAGFQRFADRSSLFTLTGRFALWGMTLDEFLKNPLLGYGPSIWDMQFRVERGAMFAGQAHNQFVQVLGQAGALGFISMLTYLTIGVYFAIKGFRRDGGLAVALLVVVMIRCMTESPLRMLGIMDWENWTHLLLFCAVASNAALIMPPGSRRLPATVSKSHLAGI